MIATLFSDMLSKKHSLLEAPFVNVGYAAHLSPQVTIESNIFHSKEGYTLWKLFVEQK